MFSAKENLILAFDTSSLQQAKEWASQISDKIFAIKLGLEFFSAQGIAGVIEMKKYHLPIFLDLKLHDIPNTVAKSIEAISKLGVAIVTIHISGGRVMLEEALKIRDLTRNNHQTINYPHLSQTSLYGVTILTSLESKDLQEIGSEGNIEEKVFQMAKLAEEVGIEGIVCSGKEIALIKSNFPKLKLIVPGIRFSAEELKRNSLQSLPNQGSQDQKRIMSPKQALSLGADFLVMGRDILGGKNILAQIEFFNDSLLGIETNSIR